MKALKGLRHYDEPVHVYAATELPGYHKPTSDADGIKPPKPPPGLAVDFPGAVDTYAVGDDPEYERKIYRDYLIRRSIKGHVPDAHQTGEVWATKPVRVKKVGTFGGDSDLIHSIHHIENTFSPGHHAGYQKTEAPGPAHAATPPGAPEAGQPANMQALKGPPKAPKKLPLAPGMAKPAKTLVVSKAQSERSCGLCGLPQFVAGSFKGCMCFRALAKSAKCTPNSDGFKLEFKADWDEDALQTLLEALGAK